jgi:hypothetical protein
MGVMLSLEGDRQARSRRRRGQHSRTSEDQACIEALAAFLRSDAMSAGRCLSRVSRVSLATRLLPAAKALVEASELVLAERPSPGRAVEIDYSLSPICLLGMCGGSNPSPCTSSTCQHFCHRSGGRWQTYSLVIAGRNG